jgi:hypothetical protein
MMKKKKLRRTARTLSLPDWLNLRMDEGLRNGSEWMIEKAKRVNAESASMSVVLKGRPWKVTIQVKRIYDKKH